MMLQVLATLGFAPDGLRLKDLAEEFIEMRLRRAREVKTLKPEVPAGRASMRLKHTFGVKTVHVIELPLHRIAENLIGFGDPLETLLGVVITGIDVRMIPASQLPKGALDVADGSGSANVEDGVQVVSTGHVEIRANHRDTKTQNFCVFVSLWSFLLLIVGIDVLGVDDVIGLLAASSAARVGRTSGLAASALTGGFVHRFRHLVRG